MLKTIPFQDRQEARHSDFNGLQTSARDTFDTLVADAVTASGPGYAGFNLTKSSATVLAIAPGRIYRTDGAVFEMEAAGTRNINGILPAATKKLVAVVAYGREEDAKSETRDFLVDLESDTTEPRTVVVQRRRAAIVDLIPGQESATLPRPAVDPSLLILGWVTLNTTGIEAISMEASTKLQSVSRNAARITSLETWKSIIEPRINTIASDITALKKGLKGQAASAELIAAFKDIARIKELLEIPDTASDYAADRFLTNDESDHPNIDYLCELDEGIRFPKDAENRTPISLYNQLDANAYVTSNGLLLPAVAKRVVRLASSRGAQDGSIPISQYGFQTHEMKQLQVARSRMRYGPAYNVCNNKNWWKQGVYDSATNTFKRRGETFLVTSQTTFDGEDKYGALKWDPTEGHQLLRVQQYWEDTWYDQYWVANPVDRTVKGAQIAQTFLNSQDGWLSGLNLLFTSKGADSDVFVTIVETGEDGTPDKTTAVAHAAIPYASIKLAPAETHLEFPPCFLDAGKRYAMLITTLGSHKVGIVDSNEYSQGTLFYSTDGAYYQGDLTRDLWFELEFLQFKAARVELELDALTLSGGIASIDILAGVVVPKSCKIIHSVLVNSKWVALDQNQGILKGLPPLLRHKVSLIGTTAVAPAIETINSEIRVWRQRTTFRHISRTRTLATSATSARLELILSKFDAARHTITVRLQRTDGSFISSTGFTDKKIDDDRIRRTFAFAFSPAITRYKIWIEGTTNNALITYHVEERVDIAF